VLTAVTSVKADGPAIEAKLRELLQTAKDSGSTIETALRELLQTAKEGGSTVETALRELRTAIEAQMAPAIDQSPEAPSAAPTNQPPRAPQPKIPTAKANSWVMAEAKRLKAAGIIPARPTDFARKLEEQMRVAAETDKSLRPVGWRYIKNNLQAWGLWPADLIK
jgi:hypothetical protein